MVNTFLLSEPRRHRQGWRSDSRQSRSDSRASLAAQLLEIEDDASHGVRIRASGFNHDVPDCPLCGLAMDRFVGEYCRSCHPWRGHHRILADPRVNQIEHHSSKQTAALRASFQLLRQVVASNPSVTLKNGGYDITGSSGARWRITPAHCSRHDAFDVFIRCRENTLYHVYGGDEGDGWAPVCLHTGLAGASFPVGDQLCGVVLCLLDDLALSPDIPQIWNALVNFSDIGNEEYRASLELKGDVWAQNELRLQRLQRFWDQHQESGTERQLNVERLVQPCPICRLYGHHAGECDWDYLEMG